MLQVLVNWVNLSNLKNISAVITLHMKAVEHMNNASVYSSKVLASLIKKMNVKMKHKRPTHTAINFSLILYTYFWELSSHTVPKIAKFPKAVSNSFILICIETKFRFENIENRQFVRLFASQCKFKLILDCGTLLAWHWMEEFHLYDTHFIAMTKPFEIHVDLQQLGQLFYKLHNIDSV